MLPRTLSAVGILLIVSALAGFLLPLSQAPARTLSDSFALSGGGDTGNVNSNTVNTNVSTNLNGRDNQNRGPKSTPTPEPTRTPTPQPPPSPTPRPTPFVLDDQELRKRVEANLKRYGVSGVEVSVEHGVVILQGRVSAKKHDLVLRAAGEAGARKVDDSRLLKVGGPVVAPAAPESGRPPDIFIEVEGSVPEESRVEVEWPGKLGIKDSGLIRVSVITEAAAAGSPPVTDIPGSNVNRFDLPANCIPRGASLRNAWPQFEAQATASLSMNPDDFEIPPDEAGPRQKSLDSSPVTWDWHLKPKSSGNHIVTLAANVKWTQRNQTKHSCDILNNKSFQIYVEDSWLNEGNLKTAQTVLGLVGVFLQLPIFIWWRRKGKEEEQGGQERGGRGRGRGGERGGEGSGQKRGRGEGSGRKGRRT